MTLALLGVGPVQVRAADVSADDGEERKKLGLWESLARGAGVGVGRMGCACGSHLSLLCRRHRVRLPFSRRGISGGNEEGGQKV